ncbi:MAG TPA: HWE histidine kinase domain-containing protein [Caulobacteraceae bacterium]|jgi:two-component sensor histidine kinase
MSLNQPAWNEAERLAALDGYEVMDTPAEADFDDLVKIAAEICGTPMALISLVDARRQWFKASVGVTASETPREVAFCAHAIQQTGVFTVEDAARDPRFAANPLVTGDPNLRFYSGAPLMTADGLPLGTLCVLDIKPSHLTPAQESALEALSRQVVAQLELRRLLAQQQEEAELRTLLIQELQHRIKNTLATVQSMVSQSLRNADSVEGARRAIEDRLYAMGRAHDIFADGNWRAAKLADVIEAAIATGGFSRGRYAISGPDVELSARAALGVALALHELNTNATKYGALSTPAGRVELSWAVGRSTLSIEWRELGGPPVAKPTRRGFGSRMIETALAGEVGGASRMDYRPDGLVWTFGAPLEGIAPLGAVGPTAL